MWKLIPVLLLGLLVSTPGLAQQGQDAAERAQNSQNQDKPANQEANTVTAATFEMAFNAINQGGTFYPFAMFRENGKTRTVTFNLHKTDNPPPKKKWLKQLFSKMRKKARSNPDITAITIAQMKKVNASEKTDQGTKQRKIPGVWVLVDQRERSPVVAFMPLVPQDNGKHKPGKMTYSGSNNWIFPSSRGGG